MPGHGHVPAHDIAMAVTAGGHQNIARRRRRTADAAIPTQYQAISVRKTPGT
jgi:hypothetical protein